MGRENKKRKRKRDHQGVRTRNKVKSKNKQPRRRENSTILGKQSKIHQLFPMLEAGIWPEV